MSTRKPRVQRNRQAILDTAREIISRQGVDGLSMRTLAEKADYSPSTLYRYFKDKDEILDELSKQAAQSAQSLPSKRQSPGDEPLDVLLHSGLRLYDFASEHPMQYQLMTSATRSSPKSLEAFLKAENFEGLVQLLESGASSRALQLPKGFDAELMALLLWFAIHGAATLRTGMMKNFGDECDGLVDRLAAAFKKMMEIQ